MRWFLIDRFVEFHRGKRAAAIKNVALGHESMTDELPGYPMFPNSLIVEGLAQTGGLLIGEFGGFRERVVLAKIAKAQFHCPALPGDTLTYHARLDDIKGDGAVCYCQSTINGRPQADVELMFAHLDDRNRRELFEPAEFLRLLRMLQLFRVGVKEDGSPLDIPPHLLEAERRLFEGPA
ncbi:MAG: 3-hydroxyacyl-ACP dehydratase FabZ family protein [Pirellulales bacterium]